MQKHLLTMPEYLTISRRMLTKYGKGYTRSFLADEDIVGEIASHLMQADLDYDPDTGNSIRTLRMTYCKNAILTILHRKRRWNRLNPMSLTGFQSDPTHHIEDSDESLDFETILRDHRFDWREKQILKMISEGCILREIASSLGGISVERVRQLRNRAYDKVREYYPELAG